MGDVFLALTSPVGNAGVQSSLWTIYYKPVLPSVKYAAKGTTEWLATWPKHCEPLKMPLWNVRECADNVRYST